MGQRRSRQEVQADILRSIGDGECKPTCIMYAANTSWNILKTALAKLEAAGLVTRRPGRDRLSPALYAITSVGEKYLRYQDQAQRLVT